LNETLASKIENSSWLMMVAVIVVLSSALALVYAKHNNRNLFIELQELQAKRDDLNVEWGRLQLEQSTFATHSYIEETARRDLQMILPSQDKTVMVKP
jgi:cell division protein FtsL